MFCIKCGAKINDGDLYCTSCGHPTTSMNQQPQQSAPQKKNNMPIIIGIIVAVFVVIAIVIGVMFGGDNSSASREEDYDRHDTETQIQDDTQDLIAQEESQIEESEETESQEEEETASEEPVADNYADVVSAMKELEHVKNSPYSNTANTMGGIALTYGLWDKNGEYTLKDLPTDKQAFLNYRVMEGLLWGHQLEFTNYSEDFPDAQEYYVYKISELDPYFSAYYEGGQVKCDGYFFKECGSEHFTFLMADGGEWISYAGYSIRENENYILMTVPCYSENNSGENYDYEYTANVLFKKTPSNLFDLQIVYIETSDKSPEIASITASSQLDDYKNKTYGASNLIDGDMTTAWVENASDTGVGETITIDLGNKQFVQDVLIFNGYLESEDLYTKNGKVTKVKVDFGNGHVVEKELTQDYWMGYYDYAYSPDYPVLPDNISLGYGVYTDKIVITILDAKSGSKYSDTCISEIRLH